MNSALAHSQSFLPTVETAGTVFHSPSWVGGGLSAFLCLLLLGWRRRCPGQVPVGQPLSSHVSNNTVEPAGIGGLSGIVSESLFVHVPEQMDGFIHSQL